METWKKIKAFDYSVSSIGRVRNDSNGFILNLTLKHWGYYDVNLCKNPIRKTVRVHRLVAEAFIPKDRKRKIINHKNGIKTDNRVENLEWCTMKENSQHAIKMGLMNPPKGEDNKASKLTENEVIEIKKLLNDGVLSQYRIAKNFGVHKVTIFDIKYGNTWKHISA